jgi:hypothetical protein
MEEVAQAPTIIAADPTVHIEVPAVSAEVVAETSAGAATPSDVVTVTTVEPMIETTATSSLVQSPSIIASSWSMSPIPEGEGGIVTSSTSVDPVTEHSAMVASPE